MDLGFSKTEKLLVESAREFLEKEAAGVFREVESSEEGYSKGLWRKMAELGWMGILFPEEYRGMNGNFSELIFLLEEMGKALVPGPFVSTMITGYSLLRYGTKMQKKDLLPKLTSGELIIIPCFIEPDPARGDIKLKERVNLKDGHYLLSGTRLFVPYARSANWFLYESKTKEGKTLFLVNAGNPGIVRNPLETLASDKQCEVVLEKATGSRL